MREGHCPLPCKISKAGREIEVPNHLELPILQYFPETPLCRLSSLTCGSLFLEQAPPIEQWPCNQ